MTRQSLPLDSYLSNANIDPHRLSPSVMSPLSLPGHVRPIPFSQAHAPASAQDLNRHARSSISSKYRSVSASPTTSRKPVPAINNRPLPPVGLPSARTVTWARPAADSECRDKISAMEAERAAWEAEKAGFQRHIEVLEEKLRAVVLEKEELQDIVTRLENLVEQHHDVDHSQIDDSGPVHRSGLPRFTHLDIPGPTALTATDFTRVEAQIGATKSPGGTTTTQTNVSASVYQHMETQSPTQQPPVETIDVSDINPSLEGIRLKSSAVQRPTFFNTKSPPILSSESSPLSIPVAQAATSPQEQNFVVAKSSKAQTLHALATDVAGRRRMHAGHTPSHSVAHFPIPVAVEVAEAALGAAQEAAAELASETSRCSDASEGEVPALEKPGPQVEEIIIEENGRGEGIMEPTLDPPDEDKALAEPLMAQPNGAPNSFLDEFTKKLEDISSGAEDCVPSVLKHPLVQQVELDVIGGPPEGPDVEAEEPVMDEEVEIPLKFKATTNFGLPWGSLKSSSRCVDHGGVVA